MSEQDQDTKKISRRGFFREVGSVAVGVGLAAGDGLVPGAVRTLEKSKKPNEIDELNRRARLEAAEAGDAWGGTRPRLKEQSASLERPQGNVPGEIASEILGGHHLLDIAWVTVACSEFTGQVVFFCRQGETRQDSDTYTLVAGRKADGQIVRGARWVTGWESNWAADSLNFSLGGGGGGAQLSYDKESGKLGIWMNGFLIGSPDDSARGNISPAEQGGRISFEAAVEVNRFPDTSQSRHLHHPFGGKAEYYMRAGNKSAGGETQLLAVGHFSVIEPISTIPSDMLKMPVAPPVVVWSPEGQLHVVQVNSFPEHVGITSFSWFGNNPPDMDARVLASFGFSNDLIDRASYPLPKDIIIGADTPVEFETVIQDAHEMAFTAEPFGGQQKRKVLLATVPTKKPGELVFAQTTAVYRSLFPLITRRY